MLKTFTPAVQHEAADMPLPQSTTPVANTRSVTIHYHSAGDRRSSR